MPRHFVVGDIHGCYHKLLPQLQAMGFDFNSDKLHALGDLIDRGPDSKLCLELVNQPWFDSVMGNHEHLMLTHPAGHMLNGGDWFYELDAATQQALKKLAASLPITRTIVTDSGTRHGLVHADVFTNDWNEFERLLDDSPPVQDHALWNRNRLRRPPYGTITGIDHVWMGHTPLKHPIHGGNLHWIDTAACYPGGYFTIEELA